MNEETGDWLNSSDSKDYFELLRFPTVGAEKEHLRDCVQCATWLKKWLKGIGAEAELVLPCSGDRNVAAPTALPVVFAEFKGQEGATTVLVYGHYDVQPADPLGEWKTPPFEPTVVGDRVYCRGAQDDKGQTFAFLTGLTDALAEREAPPTVKIVLDGQEESGSGVLTALAPGLADRLRADVLLVCDTAAAEGLRPAIVAGLRGVAHLTVRLDGPARDLHSGEYGGVAPNPAAAIARLVASLHNPDGSIAVAGFRDGAVAPTHEELELAAAGFPSDLAIETDIGCPPVGGQLGKAAVQRVSFEPTIEVNGLHSGYGGPGAKTVIPASAFAKLSLRYVTGQVPERAFAALRTHLEVNVPLGMRLTVEAADAGSPALRLAPDAPVMAQARRVLAEMDSRGPVFVWDGASIPVLSTLVAVSGASPLLVGWGQAADRIHSPNESFSFGQFERACTWGRRVLDCLGGIR